MVDKELQAYYESRFDMMASKGWADLVEDLQKLSTNYSDIRNCPTSDVLWFRKGQADILDYIINLKEVSARAWEELNEKDV
jgi:hypothetical protein